ncbi:nucleoid-associated protein [uncultured Ruthenibacterium sp.]|uniref:nucleoid-associated protein n=1 Tax=uncultured Ruthenibacterium sp. TaxID=1905347 RepID=UPI00349E8CAF
MELMLEAAVLHVLDPNADFPILSQTLLENEDALHYLGGLAAKAWNNEEAKACSFTDDAPLLAHLDHLDQTFLAVTTDLAESWFDIVRQNPSIPAADAAFLLLNIDGTDYFVGMKLNYKTGYAHFFDLDTGSASTGISRQDYLLPSASGKADEVFFVDLSTHQVRVLEKKYEIDGHKQAYLSQRLLSVRPGMSPKEKLSAIRDIAVEVNQQFYGSTGVDEAELAAAVCEEFREFRSASSQPGAPAQPAPVADLCEKLYGNLPHAREAFEQALAEKEIQMDEPIPMPAAAVRRMEKQSLRSAGGVEIKVPVSVYRDENAIEFIKNPDGTTSVLIKNILI